MIGQTAKLTISQLRISTSAVDIDDTVWCFLFVCYAFGIKEFAKMEKPIKQRNFQNNYSLTVRSPVPTLTECWPTASAARPAVKVKT